MGGMGISGQHSIGPWAQRAAIATVHRQRDPGLVTRWEEPLRAWTWRGVSTSIHGSKHLVSLMTYGRIEVVNCVCSERGL